MSRAIDIMTENPATLSEQATVTDALSVLHTLDVRHVPVINAQREVVGMVSDRDLRAVASPQTLGDDWLGEFKIALETKVAAIMTAQVISVDEETELTEIIELMLEHKVGALPVVDGDETLVGIVSYVDVLRALYDLEVNAA